MESEQKNPISNRKWDHKELHVLCELHVQVHKKASWVPKNTKIMGTPPRILLKNNCWKKSVLSSNKMSQKIPMENLLEMKSKN